MNKHRKAEIIWNITSFIKDIVITGVVVLAFYAIVYAVAS